MSFLSVVFHLAVVCFLHPTHGLESVPRSIAPIDAVRHVVNELFSNLKIKIDKNSKIKEYSKIYKYYARITRLENNDWKELVKVTSLDIKIDNGTGDLTTIINEVLNEDNKTETVSDTLNEGIVNKHIEDFLGTLEKLKTLYLRNNSYIAINNEVLQQFHKIHGNNTKNIDLNATRSDDDDEVWNPGNTRRIYQGERTRIRTFPFLASVQLFNEFACAGSVIERDLIITAASCLQLAHNNRFYRENPSFLSVRVGSSFFNGAGEVIPVIEVYFHPSYDPKTLHNNLAIMRLLRKIRLKKDGNVKKIMLDTNAWTLAPNTDGITIIGWGAKTKTNKVPSQNKIAQATLDFYPLLDCQDIYSRVFVTKKNFCAGFITHGGGACNRDIGAPGVVQGTLTGVVSFGSSTCGTADAPTVFTKLGYYTDWIEEIVEQKPAKLSVRPTTRLPIFYHTIMSTRPMREMNFLIEPMNAENIKSLHELDVRTRNSEEKIDELINFQPDYNDLVGDGEGSNLRELNKDGTTKRKESKRKTNKVEKAAGKDESSSETSHEPLQWFVTKIVNFDETDKSGNKNDMNDKKQPPEFNESKEKENSTRSTQKDDTNINADIMGEKSISDTDKELAALLQQERETTITSEVVIRESTTSVNSDQPGSKEIAQAIAILSKVVNRPPANGGVTLRQNQNQNQNQNLPHTHQQPANTSVKQELEIEKEIDDLFEEKPSQHRQDEILINPEQENEHNQQVLEDTKLLEMLEKQATEKEPKPSDDNILTLLYFSDIERDSKPVNRAHDPDQYPKESDGMNMETGNVKNLTKMADQAIAIITNADVYDILADAMGA